MAKRRRWRWVTMDSDSADVDIWPLARPKPRMQRHAGWTGWLVADGCEGVFQIHGSVFWNLTGLTIPTDRPVKVEFSAKVVV